MLRIAIISVLFLGLAGCPDDPEDSPDTGIHITTDPGAPDGGADVPVDPGPGDPGQADPGEMDPGQADPGEMDPGQADPGQADPGEQDPGTADPGEQDPGTADPGTPDPGTTDPGTPDPGTTDPGPADPGTADPGPADPGPADPGTPDPGTPDPGQPDPGQPDPGTDPGPDTTGEAAAASAAIDAARQAADDAETAGTLPAAGSWEVIGAYVTFEKPAIGNDAEGFFLQAEPTSPTVPALFVESADLATIAEGDKVSLTITEMDIVGGTRTATVYTGLTVMAPAAILPADFSMDVSSVDIETDLDLYESNMVEVTGTTVGSFGFAGTGFRSISFDTAGVTGGNVKLRVPEAVETDLTALQGTLDGCSVTVAPLPLWRYNAQAQFQAFDVADLTVDCPAPTVLSAIALSETEVMITLDRFIDAASITDAATQFTITPALAVTGASVTDDTITLTTASQTSAESYLVEVAQSVTDLAGKGVDPAANSASFSGFQTLNTTLVINEIDYDGVASEGTEYIEILNKGPNPADLTGWSIELINGNGIVLYKTIDLSGAGELPVDGYLVVASTETITAGTVEGGLAIDVGALTVGYSGGASQIQNGNDAVVLLYAGEAVDMVAYQSDVAGYTETAAAPDDSGSTVGSICRCPNGTDNDDNSADFIFVETLTPGTANACP